MVLEDIMIKMLTITETRSRTAVPYLGFVSKKRLIDVHNITWSTQHEWCIMIQKPLLQMSLKYWYAWTAVFFSTLAS